ncbi:sigma-54 dependent transcriptional regulator [bacterium]|nr:sigma-54 dependent transcriptional regulator [bacterium]MBU1073649.1 sigma-54 dependent transcriptional regulator [bacterium]MBU1674593.1 sigma-54 dependent transcriptional regulator [bacterium]
MEDKRILVVDDEESMCQYLSILLGKEGYKVTTACSGAEALALMEQAPFDVVLSDIQMPKVDGIQLLKGIKAVDPETPVIMLTAYASEQSAIDAVNLGAYSYLQKHCKNDEIKVAVRNALQLRYARSENVQLRRELTKKRIHSKIIGQSDCMETVYRMIDKISATPATILITGESGTGKELIARTIHDRSERAQKTFVAINCGAIPETLLESQLFGHVKGSFTGADRDHDGFCRQAQGGTIFLDEIGETPHAIQVKLLRMLQEREIYPVGSSKAVKVDLRVIAATNRDLEREVGAGNFRTDLFYRLNVIPIDLPALRDRPDDIPLLCDHFLKQYWPEYPGTVGAAISEEALRCLMRYEWPGNVRELENVIERACIIRENERIGRNDLPPGVADPVSEGSVPAALLGSHVALEEVERCHIQGVLDSVGGHKKRAAEILEINPSTLYRKLLRYEADMDGNDDAHRNSDADGEEVPVCVGGDDEL